jgi:hypothetical protein
MRSFLVTNSTLYSLLETVHANQLKYDIPELAKLIQAIPDVAGLILTIAALRADVDSKFAVLEAKLDKIIAQVTPPETGDTNPETAKIS